MLFTKKLSRSIAAIAALVVTASLSTAVSAAPGKTNLGKVAKVESTAVKVDGKKDEIYSKGLNIKTKVNADGVSANAWLVWSDGYMYVYAEVADSTPNDIDTATKATSPWTADSFEIFIDDDNDGKNYAMQYRVDLTGYGTWKDRNANKNYYTPDVLGNDFRYAAIKTATGYNAEMRVPLSAKLGAEVGINFQVNGVTGTSYLVKDGWNTPEYSFVVLDELVKIEAPKPSDTSSPKTADGAGLAVLALAAAGAAAYIMISKKH
jgi:hypothetical protein